MRRVQSPMVTSVTGEKIFIPKDNLRESVVIAIIGRIRHIFKHLSKLCKMKDLPHAFTNSVKSLTVNTRIDGRHGLAKP